MPFPGYPLAADKTNLTGQSNDHPAHHNALAEAVNWLMANQSIAACQINGVTSIPSGAQENLTTTTEDYDPFGWHSTSSNIHRITPTIPGWYMATLYVVFPNDIDWSRSHGSIVRNGVTIAEDERPPVSSGLHPTINIKTTMFMMNGTTDWIASLASQANTSAQAHNATWSFHAKLEIGT